MQQQLRNIDLNGANFTASAAQARRERQLRRLSESDQLGRNHRANWTGIDRAVSVSADLLINRTRVQARAATNVGERLTRHRVREHPRTSIVEQNDVQLI